MVPIRSRLSLSILRPARIVTAALLYALTATGCGRDTPDTVILAAPFGPLAYPLVYLEACAPPTSFGPYKLHVWQTPDQLRAMIAGGQADLYALPTPVAALFRNRGADIRLAAVSLWRVLWVVSADSARTAIADFAGQEIAMPFQGDLPNLVFEGAARAAGLDPARDFRYRIVPTPLDAVQQLLLGTVRHAVLSEPEISILMARAAERGLSFDRAVDLQTAWTEAAGPRGIPYGGMAIAGSAPAGLAAAFMRDYENAVAWVTAHPRETGDLVAARFPGIEPGPVAASVANISLVAVPAAEARPELEALYRALEAADSRIIGGALPDDGFYLSLKAGAPTP